MPELPEDSIAHPGLEAVREFLDATGFPYHPLPIPAFELSLRTDDGVLLCRVGFDGETDILRVAADFPVAVSADRRSIVLGCLNDLNHRLSLGFFCMDPDDGYVRFRVALPLLGGSVTPDQVATLFHVCAGTASGSYRALLKLFLGAADPATVLDLIVNHNNPVSRTLAELAPEHPELN